MKAVVFEKKIVALWYPNTNAGATVAGVTFGERGPFPKGVTVVSVEDAETEKPDGNFVSGWGEPVLKDGKVTRSQVWTPAPEQTPDDRHAQRLAVGVEWEGGHYPCLKKDRDGINGVIAGFETAGKLFQKWISENGAPTTPEEQQAMVASGAVPPEFRFTQFQWSNGEFLRVGEESAVAIAGKMAIVVSRSFVQLKDEISTLEN